MTFKVLKHKTLPDIFGTFGDEKTGDRNLTVIYETNFPELFYSNYSIKKFKKAFRQAGHKEALEQLNDYDLVEVELKFK